MMSTRNHSPRSFSHAVEHGRGIPITGCAVFDGGVTHDPVAEDSYVVRDTLDEEGTYKYFWESHTDMGQKGAVIVE